MKWLEDMGLTRLRDEETTKVLGYEIQKNGEGAASFWKGRLSKIKQRLALLNVRPASL